MDEHQRSSLHFPQLILFLILRLLALHPLRPFLSLNLLKRCPSLAPPHESLLHGRPPMRALCKTQTPVLFRSILQRNPKSDRTGRVGV